LGIRFHDGGERNTALQRAKILGTDLPDVKLSLDSLGVMEDVNRRAKVWIRFGAMSVMRRFLRTTPGAGYSEERSRIALDFDDR
jgi:hypothetical protein